MITTAFAVALGLVMGNIFQPGQGLELAGTGSDFGKDLRQPSFANEFFDIQRMKGIENDCKNSMVYRCRRHARIVHRASRKNG